MRRITCGYDAEPLTEAGYAAAMGVTEAAFVHTVRCTIEIVAKCARMPGGLGAADLALTEAAWETFVDEMREACAGG
jgi:hypothetical protein